MTLYPVHVPGGWPWRHAADLPEYLEGWLAYELEALADNPGLRDRLEAICREEREPLNLLQTSRVERLQRTARRQLATRTPVR